ncbi:MAG: hypothetical protein LBU25_10985 [Treponema sp.]|jgi:hypothetical protein|nr:hypothetical protein [Treponema sp.]
MNYRIKTAFAPLLVFFMLGCQQPGTEGNGSPSEMLPPIPLKRLMTNATPVETVCYVDVEKYNPLNSKDYIFTANADTAETQFFNYVVLGFSYLTKNERGYTQLEMTPALQYILANSKTYIKPLHLKGIRVLIEVRSGTFSDHEDGLGAGLGTMDMAAIIPFTEELKRLADQYGLDGFEFNDRGGGKRAYPPFTRDLTQFNSDKPLYPADLFKDENGKPLSPEEIEKILWIEGGSFFSLLIYRANETLKETYTMSYNNGSAATQDSKTVAVDRIILVRRDTGHGRRLLKHVRGAYLPDAYSGADTTVQGNLRYIVNAVPYDTKILHASLLDESTNKEAGEEADNKYAPFAVDLTDQKDADTARGLAKAFLLKDPDKSTADPNNQNRYGALYFTGLRPVSEADSAGYMSYFSRELFGRVVRLADSPGAGDYKKTW